MDHCHAPLWKVWEINEHTVWKVWCHIKVHLIGKYSVSVDSVSHEITSVCVFVFVCVQMLSVKCRSTVWQRRWIWLTTRRPSNTSTWNCSELRGTSTSPASPCCSACETHTHTHFKQSDLNAEEFYSRMERMSSCTFVNGNTHTELLYSLNPAACSWLDSVQRCSLVGWPLIQTWIKSDWSQTSLTWRVVIGGELVVGLRSYRNKKTCFLCVCRQTKESVKQ